MASGGAPLPKPAPSRSFKPVAPKLPGTNIAKGTIPYGHAGVPLHGTAQSSQKQMNTTLASSSAKSAFNRAFNQKFNAKFNANYTAAHPPALKSFNPKQPLVPKAGTSARGAYNAAFNSGYTAAGQAYKPPIANYNSLSTTKALGGKQLVQAAQALASAQENPTIGALQSAINTQNSQTQNALSLTGGYYNQLGQQLQNSQTSQNNIANQLNTQLGSLSAGSQQALQGIGNNQMSALAQYTPGTGGNNAATSALATEIARQQGLEAQNMAAFQQAGATQGANQRSLAASQVGTGALAGQEALRSIAQAGILKNQPLTSKLSQAISERGVLTATDLVKLRQQEINNGIAQAGLGIKEQSAQAAASNARAHNISSAAAARNAATNAQKAAFETSTKVGSPGWYRVQQAQAKSWSQNASAVGSPAWAIVQKAATAAAKARGAGGRKPLSTLENNTWLKGLGTVEQLIHNGQTRPASQGGPLDNSQIRAMLTSGQNPSKKSYDPNQVQAAFEVLGYGAIQPNTAQVLEGTYGVQLPSNIRVGQNFGGAKTPSSAINNAANALKGFKF